MIRKMELEDAARAAEICVHEWRNAYRGIISDAVLFEENWLSQRTAQFETLTCSIFQENYVFDDGSIKAFSMIGPSRDQDKTDSYELRGLYVDHSMHNKGIGTQMITFCEERACELGYSEVILWALEENSHARDFYENRGYKPDGITKYIEKYQVNEVRYSKRLNLNDLKNI